MKNLPIGIQTITELRAFNGVYVDKTELIHQLVTTGKYYFFSRPRRFGKSLTVSVLKELFKGNKAVFEGLWIENQWNWEQTHPVIHISFDAVSYVESDLAEGLKRSLVKQAKLYELTLAPADLREMFQELIEKLSEKLGRVVILIDEYDKPIIDYLETKTIATAYRHRDILRDFYAVLKSADEHLRLVFITGITKFTKVSIFSHLNNLNDITLNKKYATLTGYTLEEILVNFGDFLKAIEDDLGMPQPKILEQMKLWYNGYSWDGITKVYNPFGTLQFFHNQRFRNYWFSTGSPKFLIEQMRNQQIYDIENQPVDSIILDKFDLDNLDITSLLFQTGYLTIKELDYENDLMTLDYPNKEVRQSMYQFLLNDLARNPYRTDTGRTIKDLQQALVQCNLAQVCIMLNAILADLPAEVFEKKSEGLYHGLVHIIFSYLGMFIQSEVHSSRGRADAVVETATDIFIFEFKFNRTAAEAMAQIHAKGYANKYQSSSKSITAIAFNFSTETRDINEWLEEKLKD